MTNHPLTIKPTPDLVLSMFLDAVRRDSSFNVEKLHQGAFKLLQANIEELTESSTIVFIAEIASRIINKQSFDELKSSGADPHVVKLYIFGTVRDYLTVYQRSHAITVLHKQRFLEQMHRLGIEVPEICQQVKAEEGAGRLHPAAFVATALLALLAVLAQRK